MTHAFTHASDSPWSPTNFRERFTERRARIAGAGQRQQAKLATIQVQQTNIAQIETCERAIGAPKVEAPAPKPKRLPPITGDVSKITVIQIVVARFFQISRSDLTGPAQFAKFVKPRQIAFYLAREMTHRSYGDIARRFNRDHTTCLHGANKVASLLATNSMLAANIAAMISIIKGQVV